MAKVVFVGLEQSAAGQIAKATEPESKAPIPQRQAGLADAAQQQKAAEEQLAQLLARMNDVSSLQQSISELSAIAAAQADVASKTAEIGRTNIGKSPDQMNSADRQKLTDAADAQAKLSERTDKAIAQLSKTANSLKQSDPDAASAMQRAADQGQNQQVASQQSAAAAHSSCWILRCVWDASRSAITWRLPIFWQVGASPPTRTCCSMKALHRNCSEVDLRRR